RLGDDAQRALVPHEEVLELEAGAALADLAAAAIADLDDLAGGQDHLEADHEVAGMSVSASDERPAAGADAAADQRARIAGRVVREHDVVLPQLLVELEHVDAGADGDGAV